MIEEFREIENLINQRKSMEAKKKLKEAEEFIEERADEFENLKNFAHDIKRLLRKRLSRNGGKGVISGGTLEKLIVKYNIKLKGGKKNEMEKNKSSMES